MSLHRPLVLASAILAAYPAMAQNTPAPANPVGDAGVVIVTARRVSEKLQDLPLSIQALTGKDLSDRGISSVADLSLYTPGLSYSPDFG